ncbi:response regulator [Micromonospora sp. DT47]|uniref:response regulator n=1 Tax=Micromonospora sp. DT47 TaxID=3393431 RepID=UPI003CE7DDEA
MVAAMTPIRVVLADDHPVFRSGLRAVLESSRNVDVVGEADGGTGAVALVLRTAPDVVLMDLHMPDLNGVEATRQILAELPDTAVLVLTMLDDDTSIHAAVRAGARGYLVKGARPSEILAAIDGVAAGQVVFGAPLADRILAAVVSPTSPSGPLAALTPREREVLDLVARGLDNAAIATHLRLSPRTVRNYVSACITQLNCDSRAQAVAVARDAGLGRRSSLP